MSFSNVFPIGAVNFSSAARVVTPITIEQFCQADALEEYEARVAVNGFIILQYPRLAMICSPCGSCICNAVADTDISVFFHEEEWPIEATG